MRRNGEERLLSLEESSKEESILGFPLRGSCQRQLTDEV